MIITIICSAFILLLSVLLSNIILRIFIELAKLEILINRYIRVFINYIILFVFFYNFVIPLIILYSNFIKYIESIINLNLTIPVYLISLYFLFTFIFIKVTDILKYALRPLYMAFIYKRIPFFIFFTDISNFTDILTKPIIIWTYLLYSLNMFKKSDYFLVMEAIRKRKEYERIISQEMREFIEKFRKSDTLEIKEVL